MVPSQMTCRSDGFLQDVRFLTPCKKHQGRYSDIAAAMIPEIIKSNGLANAPVQSLLTVINGVLDESIERKNGAIRLPVAGLLIKVVQEIERRIAAQAELIRDLHNQIRSREDKYQSRMRVLEVLAYGANEETQILCNQLQILKAQKTSVEEKKKTVQQHALKLTKEKENSDKLILGLRKELETMKYTYEHHCEQLENEVKLKESRSQEKIKELELLLSELSKKVNELEASSESKFQIWNKKENVFNNFISFQLESVKGLRLSSESVKLEVLNSQRRCMEEINGLGGKLKALVGAAQNYHTILAENRKLYNEVQELKGNIRVYCRIRPFLPGQNDKPTAIDYVGENGELLLVNPSRQAKDGHRMFKFNKVFGQTATQAQIFSDIQPLIRSVLDGYNVCIFAYGQTGSGKTYTMTGLNSPSKEELGVNYRALSDLFHISRLRKNAFAYEVGVQMVEIYNEQVRDLLSNSASQKRLGIWSTTLPHGLAVPDASMVPVKTTSDVLELMQLGQSNRAVGSTAINERSSRSHSILTVHVRGVDLKTGSTSRGCLHLIDLAGSERVERSEATGDRLKEAQHINKSLSALGDVIFALSQKSTHVPYRNSKLTQVLQSSLGGQAKALMFVQINPDLESYSETLSTLKFAERVSGVELGAAKSNKEGKDIKDLIEQVASLKDMIARKDEEIEHLKVLKDLTTQSHKSNSLCQSSSSPECSFGGISSQAGGNIVKLAETGFPDLKMMSEFSNVNSDATSQLLMFNGGNAYDNGNNDDGNGSSGNAESNGRLSDASACDLPLGEEGEYSMGSTVESAVPPWTGKPSEIVKEKITKSSSRIHKSLPYRTGHALPRRAKSSDSLNSLFLKKPTSSQVATSNQMKG